MTTLNQLIEQAKKDYEANLLDGDDLYDCGKSLILAEAAFEYVEKSIRQAVTLALEAVKLEAWNEGTNIVRMKKIEGQFVDPTEVYTAGRNEAIKEVTERKDKFLKENV